MEKLKFEYSTKNIPLPSESYKLQLIEKNNQRRYRLRSFKIPSPVKELAAFKSELTELVKNIKFQKIKNQQQNQLKEDIKKISQSDKTLTFADKSFQHISINKRRTH